MDYLTPVPKKFLGIVGQDPSDSKSSQLHVDIFWFCFHSFEVYSSINSSKMIGNSREVSNFHRLLLKLNRFMHNSLPVLPGHSFTHTSNKQRIVSI